MRCQSEGGAVLFRHFSCRPPVEFSGARLNVIGELEAVSTAEKACGLTFIGGVSIVPPVPKRKPRNGNKPEANRRFVANRDLRLDRKVVSRIGRSQTLLVFRLD